MNRRGFFGGLLGLIGLGAAGTSPQPPKPSVTPLPLPPAELPSGWVRYQTGSGSDATVQMFVCVKQGSKP